MKMNEVKGTALSGLCFILLVVNWSHCASVDPLPEKCRSDTKSRPPEGTKWTFCTNTTREWSFDSKGTLCANDNDIIYIKDFQLYPNDSTCPNTKSKLDPASPTYSATCLQEENEVLAKNIAERIIKSFSGKNMSEVKEIKVIQSEIQNLTSSTYRLVVDHGCHDRESLYFNLDICDNTTMREMADVDINLRKENLLNQKNISLCSCSISSTSDLTVLAVDVRLKNSNGLKLSPEKRILRQTELYWLQDGNLIPDSQEVNITVTGLEASIPDSLWLKVTGTNMTITCHMRSLTQLDQLQDDKIDMILIIIIVVVSAAVTISAIILICCICKYKRRKQNEDMCKSPTTTPLVLRQVHKDHDEVVYSEPGKPVPARYNSPEQNYFELENTYEAPTNLHKSSMNDHEDFSAEDSVYNHLREKPDLLPSNIYNTTAKSEYSRFKRNAARRKVIANVYD